MAARSAYIGNPSAGDAVRGQAVFAKKSPGARYVRADGGRYARSAYPGSGDLFATSLPVAVVGGFGSSSFVASGSPINRPAVGGGRFVFMIRPSTSIQIWSATLTDAPTNEGSAGSTNLGPSAYNASAGTFLSLTSTGVGFLRNGAALSTVSGMSAVPYTLCSTDRGFETFTDSAGGSLNVLPALGGAWSGPVAFSSIPWANTAASRPHIMRFADGTYIAGSLAGGLFRMTAATRAAPVWTQVLAGADTNYQVSCLAKVGTVWFACLGPRLYTSTDDGQNWTLAATAPSRLLAFGQNAEGAWVWATITEGVGLSSSPAVAPSVWMAHGLTNPTFAEFDGLDVWMIGSAELRRIRSLDSFFTPALTFGAWLGYVKT